MRKEIARIRKERCKKRSAEIHEYQDEKDNTRNKKRRIDEEGQYKVVVQMKKMIREKEETEDAGKGAKKIRKETPAPVKFLGGEWKDMELEEEVDWKKRREEIIRRLEQEEEMRLQKIEKAKRLSKGWEMMRECKRIIGENSTKWKTLTDRREEVEIEEGRQIQLEKAEAKKKEFKKKMMINDKNKKITEMLSTIPKTEKERIEGEIRREENRELKEIKENLWKKWRGKTKVMENKRQIPGEIEKLDRRLQEIEAKIARYQERKQNQVGKRDKKKKEWLEKHKMIVDDTWAMLSWLHQYIEENKYQWERRRTREVKNEDLEKWTNMDEQHMIKILKETEMQEEKRKESKKEKAMLRRSLWKDWRKQELLERDLDERKGDIENKLEEHMNRTEEMKIRRMNWKKEKEAASKNKPNKEIKGKNNEKVEKEAKEQTNLSAPQLEPDKMEKPDSPPLGKFWNFWNFLKNRRN